MTRSPIFPLLVTLGATLVAPARGQAAVRFVDGACATSGTGASLVCGSSGPMRTIAEGILAMQPGDTLDIRGAHAGFDGVYFESLELRNNSPAGTSGKALACTTMAPCVIQGCPAALCGTDERPIVRGMRRRTDWRNDGGGVFSRAMEATPYQEYGGRADRTSTAGARDPYLLVENDSPMPYAGDNVATPADGRWSFLTASNRIAVNPTGGADPASVIQVPHLSVLLYAAAPTANVGIRGMTFEGTRSTVLHLSDPGSNGAVPNTVVSDVGIRHFRLFGIYAHGSPNLVVEDSVIEHFGRGQSFQTDTSDSSYGMRLFDAPGGIVRRNSVRHGGCTGQVRFSGSVPWVCSWCDSPWNDAGTTYASDTALGYQIKQTDGFTFEDNEAYDLSSGAFSVDVSRNVTVQRNTVRRARLCVNMVNYTPTQGCPSSSTAQFCYNSDHVIRQNLCEDTGVDNVNLCALSLFGNDATARHLGAGFLARVYDNFIVRPGYAGICIQADDTAPGDLLVANNSIYGANATPDASQLSRGIVVRAASENVEIRNNIIDGTTDEGLVLAAGVLAGSSYDGELIGTTSGCAVRWNATVPGTGQPSGGTCSTLAAFRTASPPDEARGIAGVPDFLSTVDPVDLHLGPRSDAIDTGIALDTFATDFDGEVRPQAAAWDIGADEFDVGGTTTSTTTTMVPSTTMSTSPPTTTTTSTSRPSTTTTSSSTSTTTSSPTTTIPCGGIAPLCSGSCPPGRTCSGLLSCSCR